MDTYFYNRIDYKGPIEKVLKKVCLDFKLGDFKSYELAPFGYEDFNIILDTDKDKFFIKIFASSRSDEECKQYVQIMELVYKNKINYPFLYKSAQGHYYVLPIEGTKVRLVVQQFIDGKNFIELGTKPTEKEKEFIVRQTTIINKLNFKPKPVYDSWAIVNFANEFKKKSSYLSENFRKELEKLLKEFTKVNIGKLPHCFVHGDIITSNIMRDNNGKIYILDFAVSNYYPRIVELASLICFNFFDPDLPKSLKEAFNFTLKTYQNITRLEKSELDILPLFIEASFAMYLIRANYEKAMNKRESEENEHWLKVGTVGFQAKL